MLKVLKFFFVSLFIIVATSFTWFTMEYFQLLTRTGEPITFELKSDSLDKTIDILAKNKIINNRHTFRIYYNLSKNDFTTIYPRTYVLRKHSSNYSVFREITTPVKPTLKNVIIPENKNTDELLLRLPDYNYKEELKNNKLINEIKEKYNLNNLTSLEGFLYPGTYNLKQNWQSRDLVEAQIEAFKKDIKKLTYQQLLKTSIISRLNLNLKSQRKLNELLNNRIKNNKEIEINEDKYFPEFNNTKLKTPISNPNKQLILLAENTKKNDYFYFAYDKDKCYNLVFFKTEKQYQNYLKQYNNEIKKTIEQCI